MANIKLKHKSIDLIPEHIRDNYKQFTAFLDAYHDWLEINQIDIVTAGDIDKTDQKFIRYFKKETESSGFNFPNINERFLLRHLKQIYLSKGTEESYRTLFKMMYGKDIIIKYPEQMCLKPSDGKWEQLISIFVEAVAGDCNLMNNRIVKVKSSLIGQNINLTVNKVILRREGGGISTISLSSGGTGYVSPQIKFSGGGGDGASAHAVVTSGVITSIVVDTPGTNYLTPPTITITDSAGINAVVGIVRMYMLPSIYECNIDKQYYGKISIGDEISYNTFKGKILPTINSFVIKNGGANFRLGQTFDIDTMFGRGATVKVSKLTDTKGIAELKFIKYGFGYISDFETSNIIPPNISTSKDTSGFIGLNGTMYEYIALTPNGGYVLKETYTSTTGQEQYSSDYSGDILREFYSANKYGGDIKNAATILFKLGAVCKYPGNYINSDGMVSDINKIQDSHLYQKFSYIIQVDEKLSTYKDIVKANLHPAGLALFGEYNLHNNFYNQIKLNSIFSVFSIKHADSVSTLELIEKLFNINVTDEKNTYLNETLDWANTNNVLAYIGGGLTPVYTANDITKLFDNSTIDFVDPNMVPTGTARLVADFPWAPSTSFALNIILQNGFSFYEVTTTGTTGTVAPTFTIGSATDGTATLTYIGTWFGTSDVDVTLTGKNLSDTNTVVDNLNGTYVLATQDDIIFNHELGTTYDLLPSAFHDVIDLITWPDLTSCWMDGAGLVLGDASDVTSVDDFDINIGIPLSKDSTVFVDGGVSSIDDTTTLADSGTVILNWYLDPLAQYVTNGYANSPNATF